MAKKEKLEALVPPEEQPYPVPDNWRWVYFGSVIELISGRDASLKECNDQGVGIPYILGASNIDSNTFTVERWIEVPQVVSIKGDILLSVKGTIGKVYLQQEEFINLSRQIMAIRSKAVLRSKYCYYFVLSICEALREAGNGLIPGISRSDILETKISVPSFEEQQRIVDRIESLFAKLDEAKEKAQAVVDGFEDRKAAILHKAFTGELTEKWRNENGVDFDDASKNQYTNISKKIQPFVLPDGWCWVKISDLFDVTSSKRVHKEDWLSEGIPFYRTRELVKLSEFGMVDNELFISKDLYEKCKKEYGVPQIGDLLISGVGTIGVPYVIKNNNPIYFKDGNVIWFQNKGLINPEYVYYLYISPFMHDQIHSMSAGTTVDTYTIVNAKRTLIPLPPVEEQRAIADGLDKYLHNERVAKESVKNLINQIDDMKKAILAKAFRGEFGTNDPADPPVELPQ